MRRAGRVEEAYQAILPMYRVHHGKYTSLAMFWCAADMVKLLLSKALEKDEESVAAYHEAEKIFMSMQRLYPKIYDEKPISLEKNMQILKNIKEGKIKNEKELGYFFKYYFNCNFSNFCAWF